jgi:hypothetical protein
VGTFIGGLKPDIAEGIRMFKPKSLKEAISLARMRDEQLLRQRHKPFSISQNPIASFSPIKSPAAAMPMKRLAWDKMQKRRSQGLCFNCDEKFTPGHKCQRPRLLLLEGDEETHLQDDEDFEDDEP